MNDTVIIVFGLVGGWLSAVWLWKRLLRGTGAFLLLISLAGITALVLVDRHTGLVLAGAGMAAGALVELLRIANSPNYTPAQASFETSQILRGLSPVEAAYFIRLGEREIFTIAVLNLLDKEVVHFVLEEHQIAISRPYRITDQKRAPEERRSLRDKIALKNNQILHSYEHAVLELIQEGGPVPLSELDYKIWHRSFRTRLDSLAGTYDFRETEEYAREVINRMTMPDLGYSGARKTLSGWYAAQILDQKSLYEKKYRPDWLHPDDDFEVVVNRILQQLVLKT